MSEDLLYHYCSLETFLSIMQNRSIRLSDITKSNDAEELTWFLRKFKVFVENWIDYEYKYSDSDKLKSVENKHDLTNPYIIYLRKVEFYDLLADHLSTMSIFAFCLSEQPDQLSQWRGYADDGKGVSIGFKKKDIEKCLSTINNSFAMKRIEYYALGDGINQLFDTVDPRSGDHKKFIDDDISDSLRDSVYTAACYKNPSFAEESEWRIIIDPSGISNDMKLKEKTKVRVARNRIIAYLDLKLDNLIDLLGEIIIGPKSEATESDIRMVLRQIGSSEKVDKISVQPSDSSYR